MLGIDEAHLSPEKRNKDDGMRGVFIDVENFTLLDITTDRYKQTVIDWLSNLKNPVKLEVVTMDMWDGYRQAIYEVFGDRVKVIIDKFHVIQELMIKFIEVRNAIFSELEEGSLRSFKNYQSLLRMNMEDLDEQKKMELNRQFKVAPKLKIAYALKEGFRSIYNCDTRLEAMGAYEKWCNSLPKDSVYDSFRLFQKTIRKFNKEIFNYFEYGRYTNASTEKMNGVIKEVKRRGHGYQFEILRAKMLYGAGKSSYKKPKYNQKLHSHNNESFVAETKHIYNADKDTYEVFGRDINELYREIESGEFFKGFE